MIMTMNHKSDESKNEVKRTRVVGLLLEVYRRAAGDDLVEHLWQELGLCRRQLAQQAVQSNDLLTVVPRVEPLDDDTDLLGERASTGRHPHRSATYVNVCRWLSGKNAQRRSQERMYVTRHNARNRDIV